MAKVIKISEDDLVKIIKKILDNETPDLEGLKYTTIDSSDISGDTEDETEKVSSDEKNHNRKQHQQC